MRSAGRLALVAGTLVAALLVGAGPTPATAMEPAAPAAAAEPGARRMLVGAAAGVPPGSGMTRNEYFADLNADVGPLAVRRTYHTGLPSDIRATNAGADLGTGRTIMFSFKAHPGEVAAGRHDAAIAALVASIPRTQPAYLTLYHEPEDNIATGQFSAAEFRAGFRRFAEIVRASDRPLVRATLILMCWTWHRQSGRDPLDYWPGDDAVEVLGLDGYSPNPSGRSFADTFGPAVAWARQRGMPVVAAEFGVREDPDEVGTAKARWLRDAADWAYANGFEALAYFDSDVGGVPFWVRSSPESAAAYRDIAAAYRDGAPPAPGLPPPAAPVTALTARRVGAGLRLDWRLPDAPPAARLSIRRTRGAVPAATPAGGGKVYEGPATDHRWVRLADTRVQAFSVFTITAEGDVGAPVSVTVRRPRVSARLSSRRVRPGDTAVVHGLVRAGGRPLAGRRVALQQRPAGTGRWRTVVTGRTSAEGVVRLSHVISGHARLRLRVVATARLLPASGRAGWVWATPQVALRQRRSRLTGRLRPAMAGERVLLQRRAGSRWTTVARRDTAADGRFSAALPRPAGEGLYRAAVPLPGTTALLRSGPLAVP